MIRKLGCLVFFLALFHTAYPQSQTSEKPARRPDIPGTFTLELGVNNGLDAPSRFDLGFWGSRTLNLYYQYDIRILKSKFSLVPGFGLSLERFKFKNGRTLAYDAEDSLKLVTPSEAGFTNLKKSQLITNFIEIPVELRFSTKPDDPARSFKASIGGRIGFLYDSFTKVKYKEDGEVKRMKNKQDFNLTQLRYGVYTKIGIGNFSVFGYYNLTPLFEETKGPGERNVVTDFQTLTVGVSLSSF